MLVQSHWETNTVYYLVVFCGAGNQTQGLVHASHVLHHGLFCFVLQECCPFMDKIISFTFIDMFRVNTDVVFL